jgi:cytochrome c-type biogenesis protein CcsB
MKYIYDLLISMKTMLILTAIFAISCSIATFIENDYGTETAWAVVYNTTWLEIVMILLAINLLGNIFKYKLYKKDKIPVFLFHLGFLVILIGAAMTRYMGYEGMMHIRENSSKNYITSRESYLIVNSENSTYEKKLLMSKISSNSYSENIDFGDNNLKIELKKYYPDAIDKLISDKNGIAMIKMLVLEGNSKPKEILLKEKNQHKVDNISISLNNKLQTEGFNIYTKGEKFFFKPTQKATWFKMTDKSNGIFEANKEYPFESGKLYAMGNIKIVPREIFAKAKIKLTDKIDSSKPSMRTRSNSAIIIAASYGGENKEITIKGHGRGSVGIPVKTQLAGREFTFTWGAKYIKVPFEVKLNDFQLERYPGSGSPSSYASEVTLIDNKNNLNMPYKIYMNHILEYKGFRLFQSSYDTDEKGTILSVSKDPGVWTTYLGYLLMAIGFIWSILNPKSRFRKLASAVQRDTILRSIALFFTLSFILTNTQLQASPLEVAQSYEKAHADKFGDLLIQKVDGRVVPIGTFSDEVMRKLAKKTTLHEMDANQVMIGMLTAPDVWQKIKFIKISHDKIKKILNLKEDEKYASFNDFFNAKENGKYKLEQAASEAMQKKPIERNQFDRAVIKADEKLNIEYMIYTGDLFKIIPKINDPMQKWYSVKDSIGKFPTEESEKVRDLIVNYFQAIDTAKTSKDWSKADEALQKLKDYQYQTSSDIIPSKEKLKAEKFFKKFSITNKLILIYLSIGIIYLIIIFTKMLKPNAKIDKTQKFLFGFFLFSFIAHTVVLALRWYIGGHAPWSNAYEAMLYIAWSMALSGIVFARYSILVPALTAIIAGITLGATFISELDPQITTLVPVLKSYWLNIHVSIITASYGFLGLSAILGFFTLILFILNNNNLNITRSIKEASRINEMTAILGLMMLTIGHFLGGVWANESWGRYWGWDPKETWAWISILVYVIVVHIRFIPSLKRNYDYNYAVVTTVAYSSIMMTFFGVNYYLSGMHSYAAGDPVPVPTYLYVSIAVIAIVIILAFFKRKIK